MTKYLILGLILLFSTSCTTMIKQKIAEKAISDMDESVKIGTIVEKPEITACAAFLSDTAKRFGAVNDKITALEAENTGGLLVSTLLKEYFIAKLHQEDTTNMISDFNANFPLRCGALNATIQQAILKKALDWVTHGKLGGGVIP